MEQSVIYIIARAILPTVALRTGATFRRLQNRGNSRVFYLKTVGELYAVTQVVTAKIYFMPDPFKAVCTLYASTYKEVSEDGTGKRRNNTVLMGSFVKLLGEEAQGWQKVKAFGIEGWIRNEALCDAPDFKCFYVDVGQGDAALIEMGSDENGMKILIDGGPADNLSRYLNKWQYLYYFNRNQQVHFDYVFISHFDKDHYNGLIDIINDEHYTFGTVFHPGIAKFNREKEDFPAGYNTDLGKRVKGPGNKPYLVTGFETLDDLIALKNNGGMLNLLEKFTFAVENARRQGRLQDFRRLDFQSTLPSTEINGKRVSFSVLGPVTTTVNGKLAFAWFDDEAHTINGHSLVLKIQYGNRSFLYGGDLNIPSEEQLVKHYGNQNPFEVDVAKSCHHGASEFTTAFMAKVNPLATVISSGDNESYAHPRADAIGCAGKYTKSERPLVFSTELARSSNVKTDEVKYGMINLRCNGENIIMAQMKEAATQGKVWDLYELG